MRWFRHLASASDDAFIEELEERFGWEGYGRWWKLLEIIAREMTNSSDPSATHSWVKWQTFLKGKRSKLEVFFAHCEAHGKITISDSFPVHSGNKPETNRKQTGNILKITCPKLLELRDEYSRKSGVTPDNVAPEVEVDKESKKERKKIDRGEDRLTRDYAFEEGIVRLTEADLGRWKSEFYAIPDFTATLRAASRYYTDKKSKDWFIRVASWLHKDHQQWVETKKKDAPIPWHKRPQNKMPSPAGG